MKLEVPGRLVKDLDYAARASGVSRTHFTREVLGAAVQAVLEREAHYRAFEEYVEARTMRRRARA